MNGVQQQHINKELIMSAPRPVSSIIVASSWMIFIWISFVVALLSMAVEGWLRAYLSLSGLFLAQPSIARHEPCPIRLKQKL